MGMGFLVATPLFGFADAFRFCLAESALRFFDPRFCLVIAPPDTVPPPLVTAVSAADSSFFSFSLSDSRESSFSMMPEPNRPPKPPPNPPAAAPRVFNARLWNQAPQLFSRSYCAAARALSLSVTMRFNAYRKFAYCRSASTLMRSISASPADARSWATALHPATADCDSASHLPCRFELNQSSTER